MSRIRLRRLLAFLILLLQAAIVRAQGAGGPTVSDSKVGYINNAIPGNLVLSEVNPHGALVPVEVQARDWLGLVGPGEFEILAGKGYGAKIRWLSEAAANQGRHLVVRDWPDLVRAKAVLASGD